MGSAIQHPTNKGEKKHKNNKEVSKNQEALRDRCICAPLLHILSVQRQKQWPRAGQLLENQGK
jgi:hypothetical protein